MFNPKDLTQRIQTQRIFSKGQNYIYGFLGSMCISVTHLLNISSFSSRKNGVRREERQEICVLAAVECDEGIFVFKSTRTVNLKHHGSLHYTITAAYKWKDSVFQNGNYFCNCANAMSTPSMLTRNLMK